MASKKMNKAMVKKNEGRPIQTSSHNKKMSKVRAGGRPNKGRRDS